MNNQTPGPLKVCPVLLPGSADAQIELISEGGNGCTVAIMDDSNTDDDSDVNEVDAAFLAAAYTLLDRTARELGVDATELASKLDLGALIVAARDVKAEHGRIAPGDETTPLDEAIYRLSHVLP